MTVLLERRADITLEAVRRVAWEGEGVELAPAALERIDAAREAFLRLLESEPELTVYGVTSGHGDRAGVRLDAQERLRHPRNAGHVGASYGAPLPERVTRAIVLARLANFVDGHAAISGGLAQGVAGLLERPLPAVPWEANGGSGEILALARLFAPLFESRELGDKEGIALINGSPCAAALLADAALAARRRLAAAYELVALAAEAYGAPLEAYDPVLAELWGDEHEGRALQRLGALLDGAGSERRAFQAPVSFRILPRVLGAAERALAGAEEAAAVSLRSVSDNPVYVPPRDGAPLGRAFSTGGYHNAMAAPALAQLALAWADLAQLGERLVEKLVFEREAGVSVSERRGVLVLLEMPAVAWSEEARRAAVPAVLARGGPGQNDVLSPAFLAWGQEAIAGRALDHALAPLAAAASQRLADDGRAPAPGLRARLEQVRELVPPLEERRSLGDELARLAAELHAAAVPAGAVRF